MVQDKAVVTVADQQKVVYRTAPFSVILNDPYPQFQGRAIL